MTSKVQKIRDEVERLRNELIQEREKGYGSDVDDACILELQNVLTYIDSLQEEPVSEELEEAAKHYLYSNILYDDVYVGNPTDKDCIEMFKAGAEWQKKTDESITNDLGEYLYELSKQFPEVSFAKLSRIGVRVAKWQKEQLKTVGDGTMNKAEKFIQDYTRNCSNIEYTQGIYTPSYHPWLTPDQARRAVEIAREEMIERAIKWVEYNNENGGCKFDGWVEDIKQTMKDE